MSLRSILEVAAPAKLNLFLHIVGRRTDGYHLLQSLFVLVDWCDTLHFERRDDGRLARHDLGAELPADDLCLRAARALQAECGTRHGVDISIDKRVPSGAGMGGGSSDAASTLLALNRLWGLDLPRRRLLEIGLALGADVPFFVGGRNALVEGIGELLTPVAVPAQRYAVVKPATGAETRRVFARLAARPTPDIMAGSVAHADLNVAAPGFGRNDLQAAAEAECAGIAEASAWLERHFGNSRMTGSGSAVFARIDADAPQAMPAPTAAGWSGRMCVSLTEHPLVGWAE